MTHTSHDMQAGRHARGTPAGFTLIELIVAIGAVALIAVGIAAIFESIGKTVSGGRRVSQLNQYAALIERQMRADFEAMTRDGVLLITHAYADGDGDGSIDFAPNSPDRVLNDPTQTIDEGRLRRIDQILFFARGDFTSARSPVVPGVNASSNEAMLWYGHGMRLDPVEDVVGRSINGGEVRYDRPQVSDGSPARPFDEERALGYTDPSYTTNPNRYAGNWALLRKVSLLQQPEFSGGNLPLPTDPVWRDIGLDSINPAFDNELQIGAQPAVSSPFSHLAAELPPRDEVPELVRTYRNGDQLRYPTRASGLVDIVTTDLAEIRRHIMDVDRFPWNAVDPAFYDPTNPNYLFDDEYDAVIDIAQVPNDLRFMYAWMRDLFPVIHDPIAPDPNPNGVRPRFEDELPDYVGTLTTYSDQRTGNLSFLQNFRLADQRMLGNAVFVPRCTEFIVEYSFGETYDDVNSPLFGQLVWHGMARESANADLDVTEPIVQPYPYTFDPFTGTEAEKRLQISYRGLDGSPFDYELDERLVYGEFDSTRDFLNNLDRPLTAYFGYNDPTFVPGANEPATVPWPWPKLIRITLTLADPVDPAIEQSFQFIFETPEGGNAF